MPEPPLGDYLGDFKDELPPDDYIVEFAPGGPKNYGYKTHKGKEDCKVRGITLNSLGQRHVNFEILKNNVLEDLTSPLESGEARVTAVPIPYKIVRNAKNTNCPPRPNKKNTSWYTTSAWWILTRSKPSRMGMSGGRKRTRTCLNCSRLSNSYSDGHVASSHLFLQKTKTKNKKTKKKTKKQNKKKL